MIVVREIAHFSGTIKYVAWQLPDYRGDPKLAIKGEVQPTPKEALDKLIEVSKKGK
jgi:hypothetical protein